MQKLAFHVSIAPDRIWNANCTRVQIDLLTKHLTILAKNIYALSFEDSDQNVRYKAMKEFQKWSSWFKIKLRFDLKQVLCDAEKT